MFHNYEEVAAAARGLPCKQLMAIAAAADGPVIDAGLRAEREGIAQPVFIGDTSRIRELLRERDVNPSDYNIVGAEDNKAAGQMAAELVRDGSAQVLMKGLLDTKDFLGPIVKKENGLRTGKIISHLAFNQLPNYHKLLLQSDGGMLVYPTLEEKRAIIENARDTLLAMGYEKPKFAVLCAIEKLNPKMVETVEAAELQRMNEEGKLPGCVVIGPISYDVAMFPDIAAHKSFNCPYCGDFDGLIMPNMQAGNILGKCLTLTVGAPMAGIIVGAKAPAVMTSRGASADEKFNSIALAVVTAAGMAR